MKTCKKCGKPIFFLKTKAGRPMPCNPDEVLYWADPKGKERVVTRNGEVIACRLTGDENEATGIGYIPHWGTCTHADEFRK